MSRNVPLLIAGLATLAAFPAPAQVEEGPTSAPIPGVSLTDTVWVRADDPSGRPGAIKIFLGEGTLVSGSCWEPYRLSYWRMDGADGLTWDEDGMIIPVEILELDESQLVVALELVSETVIERFVPASVPYVCPDLPR